MKPITPNLWFDGNAEDAAAFYCGLIPNSRVERVLRRPGDDPAGKKGDVVTVEFTLNGQPFVGINGGPMFQFTEAVSFAIECEDQAEVDRYWEALISDGGCESMCGWCKDRFGVSWQVVPRRFIELYTADDTAAAERVMQAMFEMTKLDIAALEAAAAG